ncbi:MAG: response regulator transcription factor [Burkholderiales bacterium]
MAYRVLVVDDHPLMLEIMRAVLASALDTPDVHCATDLEEALAHARGAGPPDLAVLDLGLPGCERIEALSRFRKAFPQVPVIILSATDDADVVHTALNAGARGYLPKTSTREVMQAALRLVAAGGTYVPPQVLGIRVHGLALSDRQLEVLRRMVKGLPNGRIAKDLGISRNTVKQHVRAVFHALGVSSPGAQRSGKGEARSGGSAVDQAEARAGVAALRGTGEGVREADEGRLCRPHHVHGQAA